MTRAPLILCVTLAKDSSHRKIKQQRRPGSRDLKQDMAGGELWTTAVYHHFLPTCLKKDVQWSWSYSGNKQFTVFSFAAFQLIRGRIWQGLPSLSDHLDLSHWRVILTNFSQTTSEPQNGVLSNCCTWCQVSFPFTANTVGLTQTQKQPCKCLLI